MTNSKIWFYLSFARADVGFTGAMVVEAGTPLAAIEKAIDLGAPNDSEVMSIEMPVAQLPPEEYRHRKLTKADIDLIWGGGISIREAKGSGRYDVEALEASATFVCGECLAGRCKEHGRQN